jgi:hypothetical protein
MFIVSSKANQLLIYPVYTLFSNSVLPSLFRVVVIVKVLF